ncbi:MAG: hypothetical protein WCS01_07595 [bacterium]
MKAYIVFECPQGSACWTVAHRDPNGAGIATTAHFHKKELAERFCSEVMSKRKGWWGGKPDQRPMDWHIAEVDLPDREKERLECKATYENREK